MKKAYILILLPLFLMFMLANPVWAQGGPVVLMGIDAEDHDRIPSYVPVVTTMLGQVTNGGAGILVIGGGKAPGDDVTTWWNDLGTAVVQPVTHVNGAANITAQSFAGFAMIGVATDDENGMEAGEGGLTSAENDALAARQGDIANFVNGGGALLGFMSDFATGAGPYAYLAGIGGITRNDGPSPDDIEPTPEGTSAGVSDALDGCCWHDGFTAFPPFMSVLAFYTETTNPAIIGGAQVIVAPVCEECPPDSPKGCISGRVTEIGTGAPIEGAIVRLFSRYCNVKPPFKKIVKKLTARTDSGGCYIFSDLPMDGRYDVYMTGRCGNAGGGGNHQYVNIINGSKVNDVNFECPSQE